MSQRIGNTGPRIAGSSPPLTEESKDSQKQKPLSSSSPSSFSPPLSRAQSIGAKAHATEARGSQDLKQATIQSELLNKVPSPEPSDESALEDDILLVIDLPVAVADPRDAGVDEEELEDIITTAEDGAIAADGERATDPSKAPVQAPESILQRLAKSRKE